MKRPWQPTRYDVMRGVGKALDNIGHLLNIFLTGAAIGAGFVLGASAIGLWLS